MTYLGSRTGLAWKGFTETNGRRYTGQQPGTKSAFRPADKPAINRGWTGCQPRVNRWFCFPAGLHRNSLVRACTGMCRDIPSMQRRRCTSLHPVRIQEWRAPLVLRVNDRYIPGHPWNEKGLQRQKGVDLLVGAQERRALFVPVINRW